MATGYRYADAFCLVTYTSADGGTTAQVWNGQDGPAPSSVVVSGLVCGKTSSVFQGPAYSPPGGVLGVYKTPSAPVVVPGVVKHTLGWPGQAYVR